MVRLFSIWLHQGQTEKLVVSASPAPSSYNKTNGDEHENWILSTQRIEGARAAALLTLTDPLAF
jgi:hypothetical protein